MSETANWTYTNTATVKPLISRDSWGAETWGDPYQIACTWTAESQQMTDAEGKEFVSKNIIFTEDKRPKYGDMILLNGSSQFDQIRAVTDWDMSFFEEEPDFKLVTG